MKQFRRDRFADEFDQPQKEDRGDDGDPFQPVQGYRGLVQGAALLVWRMPGPGAPGSGTILAAPVRGQPPVECRPIRGATERLAAIRHPGAVGGNSGKEEGQDNWQAAYADGLVKGEKAENADDL